MAARMAARSLQPQAQTPPAGQQSRQYLTFQIGGEMFAIPIALIREIIEHRHPTDVPMMPSFIRGIINLRGRVVPVIDLAARFGRAPSATTRRSCDVILELRQAGSQHDLGLMVDAVSAVVDIPGDHIEPPPTFGTHLRPEFICGMAKLGESFVILLDLDKVLPVDELAQLVSAGDSEIAKADTA
jgi:purine-binding chemotaxis protein CheW